MLLAAACRIGEAPPATGEAATTSAPITTEGGTPEGGTSSTAVGGIDALIAAAQAEGTLNTIGLPHDYCNYGGVIEGFKSKYGIEVNEFAPDAGPADGLEAIRVSQGSTGAQSPDAQSPDVVDIGLTLAPEAQAEGLFQQYQVESWDSIPDHAKDPDGFWYGGYYGVLAFDVNADSAPSVPADWSDLLDPQYQGQVALAGDPRVSNQAIFAVFAAALANGGSLDDAQPGLEYFAQLNDLGNLAPVIADSSTVASGETPVAIRWTYNALPDRDDIATEAVIEVVVPDSGRLAFVYVQAISAFAPHPNAARLWMEYLYSDEGQLGWLEGYCLPIRYDDLVEREVIPGDLASRLPDSSGTAFPNVDQMSAARDLITANWEAVVGADSGG